MRRLRNRSRVILVVLALLLVWAGFTAGRIWTYDATSDRQADAAIVLGASTWRGEPSPALVARIRHGVDLYRSGRVKKLIFTGGTSAGESISNAEAAQRYAVQQGVAPADILIEPYSRYTRENIAYAAEIAYQNGLMSFLIVSDPLHLKRAMCMARDRGLNAYPSATPYTTYTTWRDKLWFLRRETRFLMQYQLVTRFIHVPPVALDRPGPGTR